ncbi:hypothetical protein AHF37_09073 [Paragonimus kellicotti]|nr:hypothetical protein AHF37_09073 [Paragonimus kellicotti]
MESNGAPCRIHCSEQCKTELDQLGAYMLEERGLIAVKGKGIVRTYWLLRKTKPSVNKSTPADMTSPYSMPRYMNDWNGSADAYEDTESGELTHKADRRRNHALLKCSKLKWLSRTLQVKSKRTERDSRKTSQRNISLRFTTPHMQPDRQLEEMPHKQILQDSSLNQLSGTGSRDYIPSACLGVWEYYPTPPIFQLPSYAT